MVAILLILSVLCVVAVVLFKRQQNKNPAADMRLNRATATVAGCLMMLIGLISLGYGVNFRILFSMDTVTGVLFIITAVFLLRQKKDRLAVIPCVLWCIWLAVKIIWALDAKIYYYESLLSGQIPWLVFWIYLGICLWLGKLENKNYALVLLVLAIWASVVDLVMQPSATEVKISSGLRNAWSETEQWNQWPSWKRDWFVDCTSPVFLSIYPIDNMGNECGVWAVTMPFVFMALSFVLPGGKEKKAAAPVNGDYIPPSQMPKKPVYIPAQEQQDDAYVQLTKLKTLVECGLISEADYAQKKKQILDL